MRSLSLAVCLAAAGCGSGGGDAPDTGVGGDAGDLKDGGSSSGVCSTHVSFGDGWLMDGGDGFVDLDGYVTWDGTCTSNGADSYAQLSDGTRVGFAGHEKCILVTAAAPNVGGRIEGTFSATVKTGSASLSVTEGAFSIVRTAE